MSQQSRASTGFKRKKNASHTSFIYVHTKVIHLFNFAVWKFQVMDSDDSSVALTSSLSSSSSSSSSASSYSSDNEALELIAAAIVRRAPRIFRIRNCPYEVFSDIQFKKRFRLSKASVQNLVEIIGPRIEHPTRRNHAISALNQIIITLRFLCTGAFQIFIGDNMRVDKSTVCRIVKRVVRVIAGLRARYIYMPRNEVELAATKSKFRAMYGFPSVIGCVDGTHIKMQSPGGDRAESYRNRKSYFSYNVQAVCDADLRILSIDARWPGSTHDSTVFNASLLRVRFEEGEFNNCFLLGDSAYRSTNYM